MNHRNRYCRCRTAYSFLAVLATLCAPGFAFAANYPGKDLLNWCALYLFAPFGLFAIVIAIVASFYNQQYVKTAAYAAIACAVLFFIVKSFDTLVGIFAQV